MHGHESAPAGVVVYPAGIPETIAFAIVAIVGVHRHQCVSHNDHRVKQRAQAWIALVARIKVNRLQVLGDGITIPIPRADRQLSPGFTRELSAVKFVAWRMKLQSLETNSVFFPCSFTLLLKSFVLEDHVTSAVERHINGLRVEVRQVHASARGFVGARRIASEAWLGGL